jgi:hypothetical protein
MIPAHPVGYLSVMLVFEQIVLKIAAANSPQLMSSFLVFGFALLVHMALLTYLAMSLSPISYASLCFLEGCSSFSGN